MKRVYIAIGLLALVVAMSVGALLLQNRTTERLIDSCNELIEIYQRGEVEECRRKAQELSENMEQEMRWFPFFLAHDRMESIFQQAGALPYLVSDDDPADFFSALAVIRVQLGVLRDSELPTPENIM